MAYGKRKRRKYQKRRTKRRPRKYGRKGKRPVRKTSRRATRRLQSVGKTMWKLSRLWPPTTMQVTFEDHQTVDVSGTIGFINDVLSGGGLYLAGAPNGQTNSWFNSADAAGSLTSIPTSTPRNWSEITSHYSRGRFISKKYVITLTSLAQDSGNVNTANFDVFSWMSSAADGSNPVEDLDSAVGKAAPWDTDTNMINVLTSSRRVVKRSFGPTKSGAPGRITLTFIIK